MPNFEGSQEEKQKVEETEMDDQTFREIVYEMFFNARPLKTITELSDRIQAQAKQRGIPRDILEREIMGDIHDAMSNRVD